MKIWKPVFSLLALLTTVLMMTALASPAQAKADKSQTVPNLRMFSEDGVAKYHASRVPQGSYLSLEYLLEDGTWALAGSMWASCPDSSAPWEAPRPNADKKPGNNGYCHSNGEFDLPAGTYRILATSPDFVKFYVSNELVIA